MLHWSWTKTLFKNTIATRGLLLKKLVIVPSRKFKISVSAELRQQCQFIVSFAIYSATISCAILWIKDHYYSITAVDGRSMQPTLNPGDSKYHDWVFLDRKPMWDHMTVRRGDIVTFRTTRDPNTTNIKRVIGLEGDTVTTLGYKTRQVLVPAGHCWVEGDNHDRSDDSNNVGPIPLGLLTARANHVIFPPSRWQQLPRKLPHDRLKINPNSEDAQLRHLPTIISPSSWRHRT